MRFFFDANLPVPLLATMKAAYPTHDYDSALDLGLAAEEDERLLSRAAALGAEVFVTGDLRQMRRDNERTACRRAGLHWIGLHQPARGITGLAAVAALTSPLVHAAPLLLERIAAASAPTSFVLRGHPRDPTQIFARAPEPV